MTTKIETRPEGKKIDARIGSNIPDLWHVYMALKEAGNEMHAQMVLNTWHLTHDCFKHICKQDDTITEMATALDACKNQLTADRKVEALMQYTEVEGVRRAVRQLCPALNMKNGISARELYTITTFLHISHMDSRQNKVIMRFRKAYSNAFDTVTTGAPEAPMTLAELELQDPDGFYNKED